MGRIDRQPVNSMPPTRLPSVTGDLIPEPPCGQADVCAEHHADRHQKHVDHGMFKPEKNNSVGPQIATNFPDKRRRHIGRDDGGLTIQLHKHTFGECREQTRRTVRGVVGRFGLCNGDQFCADGIDRRIASRGQRDCEQRRIYRPGRLPRNTHPSSQDDGIIRRFLTIDRRDGSSAKLPVMISAPSKMANANPNGRANCRDPVARFDAHRHGHAGPDSQVRTGQHPAHTNWRGGKLSLRAPPPTYCPPRRRAHSPLSPPCSGRCSLPRLPPVTETCPAVAQQGACLIGLPFTRDAAESAQEDPTPSGRTDGQTRSPRRHSHTNAGGIARSLGAKSLVRGITPRASLEPRGSVQKPIRMMRKSGQPEDLTRRRYCTEMGERTTIPRRPRSALSDLLSNPAHCPQAVPCVGDPALTVLLLGILTYRSVTTFSDDEGTAQRYLLLPQRLASEVSSAGRRSRNGVPWFHC